MVFHVLNRLAFGPRPGDVDHVISMGTDHYIQEQLHPEAIEEDPVVTNALDAMPTLDFDGGEILARDFRPRPLPKNDHEAAEIAALRDRRLQIDREAVAQRFVRAVASRRQLQEVLVDFWFNHFNVFCCDKSLRPLVGSFEQQAIRPHVLGRFRDLLGATAHHPAMLIYLDNVRNVAPGRRGPGPHGLNENYARELMELHTLGADGGYTQGDVMALARVLSGWGMPPAVGTTQSVHGFYFDASAHESGDKRFLGEVIPAGGQEEGEKALDMLARSPATAHHIAFELAQYFVTDDPDPTLVATLAQRFQTTDGDLREVLSALFQSSRFWDPTVSGAKFKTPFQFVVSAIRACGIDRPDGWRIGQIVAGMGERLYANPTPDGYKNTADAWRSPDALHRRITFAHALAAGSVRIASAQDADGVVEDAAMSRPRPGQPIAEAALRATLEGLFEPRTLAIADGQKEPLSSAVLLASPEFMVR